MGDDTKTGGMKPEVQPLTSPIGTGNQAGKLPQTSPIDTGNQAGKLPQTSPIDTGNQAGKLPQTSPIDTGNQAGEKTSLQDAGDGYVNFQKSAGVTVIFSGNGGGTAEFQENADFTFRYYGFKIVVGPVEPRRNGL